MSMRLPLNPDPSADVLEAANRLLAAGGVLAMPTESYYALGARACDGKGVRRVCAIKDRGEDKPILVLIGDREQLPQLVTDVPAAAKILMDRFWPGPLTLVFPAAPHLPPELTRGTGTVGVRQPARQDVLCLLRCVGPLTGTSANRSGYSPVQTADKVSEELGTDVDLILEGGETSGGLPSTLVDITRSIHVLREGPVSREAIRVVLKESGILMPDQPL
jgi:L-threonylcarbamoyladenylate synthase